MIGRLKRGLFHCIRLLGGFPIAQRITRTQLRILCYHGFSISDEHELAPYVFMRTETFERRMRILHKRGLSVISLDDGWASDLLIMPILESYRFPACVYITTEHLNAGTEAFNVTLAQMVRR